MDEQLGGQPVRPSGATEAFVWGIVGIAACQLVAPVAWIKGNAYVNACRDLGVEPEGLGVAGRILGIIGSCLLGFTAVIFLLYLAFIIVVAVSSS